MTLRLDWCSHRAASAAVKRWHYSGTMPTPPVVKIGAWEDSRFIGCVLFSRGANNHLGWPYGCDTTETCELTRVALTTHVTPVSRIVAIAIRFLTAHCPGLRLIVSFADPNNGHHGGIYQAGNWIYVGDTPATHKYVDANGREWHQRQVSSTGIKPQYGVQRRVPKIKDCVKVPEIGKHRYLMPLDAQLRAKIAPLAKPYPKRAGSILADAPTVQVGEGGAAPTPALRSTRAKRVAK